MYPLLLLYDGRYNTIHEKSGEEAEVCSADFSETKS